MKAEKKIWELAQEVINKHGEMTESLHLIESTESYDYKIRIYHGEGYCWDLEKQFVCEPNEIKDYQHIEDLQEDGCIYNFFEEWEGFKKTGITGAHVLLREAL